MEDNRIFNHCALFNVNVSEQNAVLDLALNNAPGYIELLEEEADEYDD